MINELKTLKVPVSYGNHSNQIMTIPYAVFYEPNFIFFYIKNDYNLNKLKYLDDKHAVKIKNISKILEKIEKNKLIAYF